MKQIIAVIAGLSLLIAGVLFYNYTQEEAEVAPKFNSDLSNIFSNNLGFSSNYFGLAEYGHYLELKEIKESNDQKQYFFEGYLNDAKGDDTNDRTFSITYTIDDEKIVEKIINNDYYHLENGGSSDTLNSIVPNQTILKLPLIIDNSWETTFTYNNESYVATTKIKDIAASINGNKIYTTELIVNDIPGFFNDRYIETRQFELGVGEIVFSNSMLTKYFDTSVNLKEEDYLFGYSRY